MENANLLEARILHLASPTLSMRSQFPAHPLLEPTSWDEAEAGEKQKWHTSFVETAGSFGGATLPFGCFPSFRLPFHITVFTCANERKEGAAGK